MDASGTSAALLRRGTSPLSNSHAWVPSPEMPPEMTFGRSVRYRRTKIGLSQTRLGELVGRSSAAVRSWERDASVPSDPSVLEALSAVLGIDKETLFEKAGIGAPAVETSPTVEEALGTLAPTIRAEHGVIDLETADRSESDDAPETEGFGEAEDDNGPAEEDWVEEFTLPLEEPKTSPLNEPAPVTIGAPPPRESARVGIVSPVESIVYTIPAPPVAEPTYIEDESQRQVYRIRNLATLVLVVGLIVMFFWAMSNGWSELNSWWDDFSGQLQL